MWTTFVVVMGSAVLDGSIFGQVGILLKNYDKLYLLTLLLCIYICVLFSLFSYIPRISKLSDAAFDEAWRKRAIWLNSSVSWMVVHFWFIGSSFLSTLIVVYESTNEEIDSTRIIFYSIASLLTTVLDMIVLPMNISKGFRKAYEEIDSALVNSVYSEVDDSLKEARKNGEKLITDFTYGKR